MKARMMMTGILCCAFLALTMTGCSEYSSSMTDAGTADTTLTADAGTVGTAEAPAQEDSAQAVTASYTLNTAGILDTASVMTDRDLEQTADLDDAVYLTVSDGETLSVTQAGVYVLSGSASDCTIRVEAPEDAKVQLVLDGVSVENADFPVIYVVSADKVFVTTTDSENTLSVTGSFTSDGEINTDAVIFSKEDLVLGGTGSLTVTSAGGNGITSKDDLKVTGGSYTITSALDALEANDLAAVTGGSLTITAGKDGIHAENDEGGGSVWIAGGSLTIQAESDGIQATQILQIDDGTLDISASEGLEATYVQIGGGTIAIAASDDGINATAKSTALDVVIEINGGDITVNMAQGDTDALDANGSIYINGGTLDITAPTSSFDYDGTAEFSGGTIIINGQEVTEIPQSMMGAGFGGMGGRGGMNGQSGMNGRSGRMM